MSCQLPLNSAHVTFELIVAVVNAAVCNITKTMHLHIPYTVAAHSYRISSRYYDILAEPRSINYRRM